MLKAKLEILEELQESGTVVINNDNGLLHIWAETEGKKYNCNKNVNKTIGLQ